MKDSRRITIVTGHYGSGKSEFSIALAILLREYHAAVCLVDVDVVNPYFRSREQRSLLEERDITVVANQLGVDRGVDLPAISPKIYAPLQDGTTFTVVDTGGDPAGARLLGTFRRMLDPFETEVLCVINGSRPDTADVAGVIAMIRGIEGAAGLAVTGLVNNTHMLEHTAPEHILRGDSLCRDTHRETGIPLKYTTVPAHLAESVPQGIEGEMVTMRMYLRETWMHA
jgi:energy-coupling factor transporter ATP-binding protein EcfA2